MEVLFFALLTVPVFYIYGIICFFRNFTDKDKPNEASIKQSVLNELAKEVEKSPGKSIKEFYEEYKKHTAGIHPVIHLEEKSIAEESEEKIRILEETPAKESFFATWYSNNSINLLLYIGAFFIVSAAAIFVGFQWETISGTVKALLLTLVAGGFFGFGYWFYGVPKIKTAGTTFIGIAAILIPVVGAAWYNFVLRDAGIPVGIVWLLTSLLALIAYVGLALHLRYAFYSYASSIGTFSLMLSLVRTFGLAQDFYILAGIVACFVLFIFSKQMKHYDKALSDTLGYPWEMSSQIAMPITLVYGLIMAISESKLFTFEGVFSVVFAALFYFAGYYFSRESWKLAVSEVLFLAAMYLCGNWLAFPQTMQYYLVALTGVSYAGHAYYFGKNKKSEEADVSLVVGMFSTILVFVVGWFSDLPPASLALLTVAPIAVSIFTVTIKKNHYPLLIASAFLAILVFITYNKILLYDRFPEYLGLIYLLFAVGKYMITYSYHKNKDIKQIGYAATALYSLLSVIFSYDNHWVLLICTLTIAGLFFATSLLYRSEYVSYGGVAALCLSLLLFLSQMHTPLPYYPLLIGVFAFALYAVGLSTPHYLMKELRSASLVVSALFSVYFFLDTVYNYHPDEILNRNALIGAYGTVALFGMDYSRYRIRTFGYITSAIALCTLLWHIYYLGYSETLFYTTPIGLYFMGLAYTRNKLRDKENEQTLQAVGLFFLLLPPLVLSFGEHAVRYSVILGLEGILLVLAGINFSKKVFRFAGFGAIVLAVLPQTYNYILSLPRWAVIGLAGIIFLSVAIFLLLKRKEDH